MRIDEVDRIHGIFNGTSNYILDHMQRYHASFEDILKEAQELGYAPDVKLYRQNPDGYRGHVGDISGMLRIAVTGRESSPDLFEVMRILGRGAVLGRLRRALDALAQR